MKTPFCIFTTVLLVGFPSHAQVRGVFRDRFDEIRSSGEFTEYWETTGGNWELNHGSLTGRSGKLRAFAYAPDVPEYRNLEILVKAGILEREHSSGWSVAGVVLFLDPTNFWQLSLVEGPDGRRYAELVEMYKGTWQAQRESDTALECTTDESKLSEWEYGKEYEFRLVMTPERISGTISDAATGQRVRHIEYRWSNARGVKTGRPGIAVSGFAMETNGLRMLADPAEIRGKPAIEIEAGLSGKFLVLRDVAAGMDLDYIDRLSGVMRGAGFGITAVSCDQLTNDRILDGRYADGLILTESPSFPAPAVEDLSRFLRGGGNLVLMGGPAFSNPLHLLAGEWLTEEQINRKLAGTPPSRILLDFTDGSISEWKRGTNHPEQPSKASLATGPAGPCIQFDIRGLNGWDTFQHALPENLPESCNLLCFRAKGAEQTNQMAVELKEKNGSRWIAVVDITPEWRSYALHPGRFEFWQDGSGAGSTQTPGHVRMSNAQIVSFGLAGSHTPELRGDHQIRVDEIGIGYTKIPEAYGSADFTLNAFSDYPAYRMNKIRQIVPFGKQTVATEGFSLEQSCRGWSAVGFAFPNESRFIPVLSALDANGRNLGWAAGILANHRGAYRNSCWLLFGIESREFYDNRSFMKALPKLVKQITEPELTRQIRQNEKAERKQEMPLRTPPPHRGFIKLSEDGKHLVYPDGHRFFMIGCNYVGGFARCAGRMWSNYFFDAEEVEDDFRKAHRAGLNVMRYWLQGTLDRDIRSGDLRKVNAIRECARRYGVYLLLDLPGTAYSTVEEMLASHRAIAKAFRDEPMVLGYDLRNEPYVTTIGGIHYPDNKPPVQTVNLLETYPGSVDRGKMDTWLEERPWWLHLPPWIRGEEARKVTVANMLWKQYARESGIQSSSLPGFSGTLPTGRWGPLIDVVDTSLRQWIELQTNAIREVDPNHLITVGHNTALCLLPANDGLDFVSKHIYIRPFSYDSVIENITTLDRLAKRWPDRPITLGEFGYSNGIPMDRGYLDHHASSVGEMIHFLYALSRGYDGCKKWMLVDWPLAVMRHYGDWNRGLKTRIYEERFGLYYYDGTMSGRAKPIVHALRFLGQYVDRSGVGGDLSTLPSDNPIHTRYVFRKDDALFVGDVSFRSPELSFNAQETSNVMLAWDREELRIMSTADAKITLDPAKLAPEFYETKKNLRVEPDSTAASSDGSTWTLRLTAGEDVILK